MSDEFRPSPEAARSRQTAMQAERHFFISRLREMAAGYRARAVREHQRGNESDHARETQSYCYGAEHAWQDAADDIDRLIAEREK